MIRQCIVIALLLPVSTALANDCRPQAGFERALAGQEAMSSCETRAYRIDFELGRNLRRLQQEQAELQDALGEPVTAQARHLKRRLQVVERELEQLEGLARIRGLLPPQPDPRQG